ncbi:MAG: cadmium resistance transporter [Cyclobacteriaceae bacterium]
MEILLTSVLAFISTNIDDVFLLILFFGNKRFKEREIVVGQFLGIAALIAVSFAISFIGLVIDKVNIGLLGFLPIYFGIKGIIHLRAKQIHEEEKVVDPKSNRNNILTVAGTTIANGGDNIGIYVPLFATLGRPQQLSMISIFFVMTAFWCLLAKYFTKHPLIAKAIDKYGHMLTPFVLIFLGIYILYQSGASSLIWAMTR